MRTPCAEGDEARPELAAGREVLAVVLAGGEGKRLKHFAREVLGSERSKQARLPRSLLVHAARGVQWSDWGDPDRIVRTLRRLQRQPPWLPAYARAQRLAPGA